MKAGNIYTIKVGNYGTITYTTAYGTDLAKIPVNTPAGEGRTAQFGKDISEFTMKIDFMSYTELPSDKWINLYDDAEEISAYAVTSVKIMRNTGLMQGKLDNRFDPKGTALRSEVATLLMRFCEVK